MQIFRRPIAVMMFSILISASGLCAGQPLVDTTLLDEDFSGSAEGSMDNVSYGGGIDDITSVPDWDATATAHAAGCFVFAPSLYSVALVTPRLPVSGDNPIKLSLTLAEYGNERYYTGGEVGISLVGDDGIDIDTDAVTVTEPGFSTYDMMLDIPRGTGSVRVRLSYGDGGLNRKLYLDRITVSQTVDAGVGEIVADTLPHAWISGPHEITVSGERACIYTLDGRCIYDGPSATLRFDVPAVIVSVDGVTVKLQL